MAACESIQHVVDNPMPENPTYLITPPNPVSSSSSSSSLALPVDSIEEGNHGSRPGSYHRRSESFSSMNIESLQLCTEGLGFESLDNIEGLKMEFDTKDNNDKDNYEGGGFSYNIKEKLYTKGNPNYRYRKARNDRRVFPPPISCIDKTGKPCTSFQSYKEDGRFILKETRIQSQDILHACREDGRLRLNFIYPSEHDDDSDDCDNDSDDDDEREQEDGMLTGELEGGEIRDCFEKSTCSKLSQENVEQE